ncbi:MAG: GH129 [uncultured Chloroflexia bacterium]|uniref:GH129 n=1 Tax=uncultured Chloroflexia bacterium TaxID=1672391 RepID=A0A6J4N1Z9_9CHLR|nr:MAG: GH129 [uncultured Chloroflexia bacterium]
MRDQISGFDALHFDTTTAKALNECWHPEHPMSKSEDRTSRRARLAEVASWGCLIGSEAGYDWAFDVYDFCSSNPRRAMETHLPVHAEHVPLLGLVYHDSVVSYCWEYDPYNKSYFGVDWSEDKLLYDAMAGNPPTVAPIFGYFPVIRRPAPPVESHWVTWEDPTTQKLLRDALPVAQMHGRTAHHEMLEHAFLDTDRTITRTVYKDGTAVVVNFGHQSYSEGGLEVDARSYHVS